MDKECEKYSKECERVKSLYEDFDQFLVAAQIHYAETKNLNSQQILKIALKVYEVDRRL